MTREVLFGCLPRFGTSAEDAANVVRKELAIDAPPIYNLASYLTAKTSTPQIQQLMSENLFKNMGEIRAYPGLANIEQKCVSMLVQMFHSPLASSDMSLTAANGIVPNTEHGLQSKHIGTCTVGSSEAIMLAGLAMKRRWQEKRRSQGKDDSHPNIVMGSNTHTAQHKFANYFDVEKRIVDVDEESRYCLPPHKVVDHVDENTIGVLTALGNNFTGHFDDIDAIAKSLDRYEDQTGHSIPIHVDAAVGGFIAPFVYDCQQDLMWDFAIPRVQSINVSGHKYALSPPGVAWVVWKDRSWYPESLIHEINYLVSPFQTVNISLSRPSAPAIVEYFNFQNLGFEGFRQAHNGFLAAARRLSYMIENLPWFECISDIHRRRSNPHPNSSNIGNGDDGNTGDTNGAYEIDARSFRAGLPVVVFRFRSAFLEKNPHVKLSSVSLKLRNKGYLVPCYTPPTQNPKCQQQLMRIIVREEMTIAFMYTLVGELIQAVQETIDLGEKPCNDVVHVEIKDHENSLCANTPQYKAEKPFVMAQEVCMRSPWF